MVSDIVDYMGSNKINAVIWDLDGTLIDSGSFHFQAEKEALKEFGIDFNTEIYERYLSTKFEDFVNAIIHEQDSGADPNEVLAEITMRSIENYIDNIPLTKNAVKALEKIKSDHQQALATAREKELAMIVVNRFSLGRYFDEMVFAEDVDKGKPHPEVFLLTAKLLKTNPESCLVIEDGLNGILAANSAGMTSVAFKSQHNNLVDFSTADHVIDDPIEVLDILKQS